MQNFECTRAGLFMAHPNPPLHNATTTGTHKPPPFFGPRRARWTGRGTPIMAPFFSLLFLLLWWPGGGGPCGAAAAAASAAATRPAESNSVTITSFGKTETTQGDVAQLWFTLTNTGEAPADTLRFQVALPAARVRFVEASVMPRLKTGYELRPHDDDKDETEAVLSVVWPEVAVAPGQSRVFNVDVKVEALTDEEPLRFVATAAAGGGGNKASTQQALLGTHTIVMTNKPPVTKESLREKQKDQPLATLPMPHKAFDNCKPLRPTAALVAECLSACDASTCTACGYNYQAGSCVCKGHGHLEDVLPLEEEEEEAEEEEEEALLPLPPSKDRRTEILVFPALLSEGDCGRMEAYLAELVAEHKEQRKIVEAPDSPLHALARAVLPVPGVAFTDHVTFSEEDLEVDPHYDAVMAQETHKLLLYLDEVAGTRFWETKEAFHRDQCPLEVAPGRGTVVIFPMSLYHDSGRFPPSSTKRTLGLRMMLPGFGGGGGQGAEKVEEEEVVARRTTIGLVRKANSAQNVAVDAR